MKECIACAEDIKQNAKLCRYCGTKQDSQDYVEVDLPRSEGVSLKDVLAEVPGYGFSGTLENRHLEAIYFIAMRELGNTGAPLPALVVKGPFDDETANMDFSNIDWEVEFLEWDSAFTSWSDPGLINAMLKKHPGWWEVASVDGSKVKRKKDPELTFLVRVILDCKALGTRSIVSEILDLIASPKVNLNKHLVATVTSLLEALVSNSPSKEPKHSVQERVPERVRDYGKQLSRVQLDDLIKRMRRLEIIVQTAQLSTEPMDLKSAKKIEKKHPGSVFSVIRDWESIEPALLAGFWLERCINEKSDDFYVASDPSAETEDEPHAYTEVRYECQKCDRAGCHICDDGEIIFDLVWDDLGLTFAE